MKGGKQMKRSKQKGITLIALVITIIVLLILAAISIATLTGQNGILSRANEAAGETARKTAEEKVAVEVLGSYGEDGNIDYDLLNRNLQNVEGLTEGLPISKLPATVVVDGYDVTINADGSISVSGDEQENVITGKYYETDTDITVGGKPVTIPGGATISGIEEETDLNNGLVIYITNGEEVKNWEEAKTKYDQFVWVPVTDAVAVDMNDDKTVDETDIDLMIEQNRYPMAISTGNGNYRGILYGFSESKGTLIISGNYSETSGFKEPGEVDADSSNGIPEGTLQEEYNTMVEREESKKGFWVGRYETTNMDSSDFTTEAGAVNIVKGTTNGISNVNWYTMYNGQKVYKNSVLITSTTTSSMIWGSQWDQIMIWMKDIPSIFTNMNFENEHYITNSVKMGNYGKIKGIDDGYYDTSNPSPTGCYNIRNIYDLAGNVSENTLETAGNTHRLVRRRNLRYYF